MATYLLLRFTVTIIISTILQSFSITRCIQLPDIYWHPDDPLFNKTLCRKGSREIFVREHDVVNIVCGNRDLNNAIQQVAGVVSPKGYTYNILVTQDSQLFQDRRIQFEQQSSSSSSSSSSSASGTKNKQKAKMIYICRERKNNKDGVYSAVDNKYSIVFTPARISVGQYVFKGGNTYYFYTTSDGSEAGAKRNQAPPTVRHMFLKVRVCGPNEICDRRQIVKRCLQPMVARPQVSDGLQRENLVNSTTLPVLLVMTLVLGILIGIAGPCVWNYIKNREKIKKTRQNSSEIEESKESASKTSYNEDEGLMCQHPNV